MSTEITLYDISIRPYIATLTSLLSLLRTASAHPSADTLPSATLITDMKPLLFQTQSCLNTITRSLSKILNPIIPTTAPSTPFPIPVWEDDQTTLPELITRAEETLVWLKGLDKEVMEGAKETMVYMPDPIGPMQAKNFVLGYGVSGAMFHLQMVYAVLRMSGVDVGKGGFYESWNEGMGDW